MFVLVNLKAYSCDPVSVARAATAVDTEATVALAPQTTHLRAVAETDVRTWAQHVDPTEHGSHTGHVLAEAVADTGATGTLLNHSERRLQLGSIDDALGAADRAGLDTVVCANNPDQVATVTALGPGAVAVEPPGLIGTDTSVSQANPETVRDAVEAARAVDPSVPVYCGAGISSGADIAAARELGADGVLLASGVAKARDPAAALADLLDPV
jgi:triosephosphate isomerase